LETRAWRLLDKKAGVAIAFEAWFCDLSLEV